MSAVVHVQIPEVAFDEVAEFLSQEGFEWEKVATGDVFIVAACIGIGAGAVTLVDGLLGIYSKLQNRREIVVTVIDGNRSVTKSIPEDKELLFQILKEVSSPQDSSNDNGTNSPN